jgi:hypothetical protein
MGIVVKIGGMFQTSTSADASVAYSRDPFTFHLNISHRVSTRILTSALTVS